MKKTGRFRKLNRKLKNFTDNVVIINALLDIERGERGKLSSTKLPSDILEIYINKKRIAGEKRKCAR